MQGTPSFQSSVQTLAIWIVDSICYVKHVSQHLKIGSLLKYEEVHVLLYKHDVTHYYIINVTVMIVWGYYYQY